LQVQGKSFGTIVEVHETMWDWNTPNICRGTLANWYKVVGNSGSLFSLFGGKEASTKLEETFKKMICTEVVYDGGPLSIVRRMVPEDELTFILWASKSPKAPFHTHDYSLDKYARETWSAAARAC
jgi:hypothetical protein